jgi:hypothetical protein
MRHCKAEAMSWDFVREGGERESECMCDGCVCETLHIRDDIYTLLHTLLHTE